MQLFYALYLMVMLCMFRASLAHHQEFEETVFAARCLIQLFLNRSFVCHVLHLCKVSWVLEWCAMVVRTPPRGQPSHTIPGTTKPYTDAARDKQKTDSRIIE